MSKPKIGSSNSLYSTDLCGDTSWTHCADWSFCSFIFNVILDRTSDRLYSSVGMSSSHWDCLLLLHFQLLQHICSESMARFPRQIWLAVWPSPYYLLRENSSLAQADLSCYCSSSTQAVYHRENKIPVRQDHLVRMKASTLCLKSSGVEEGWVMLIRCCFAICQD